MSPCRAPPRGLAPPRSVLRPRPPPSLTLRPSVPARILGPWRDQKLAMGPGALCGQHKCPRPECGPSGCARVLSAPAPLRPRRSCAHSMCFCFDDRLHLCHLLHL